MLKTKRFGLLLLAVGLLATLMRPPIAIVGPLLGQITESYKLDAVMVSAVNSLPLLCFGLGAFLAPRLERLLGMRALVLLLTALLTVSIGVRGWAGEELFLIGTFVLSICISLANVLLPTLVRMLFPERIGLATGFYVTVMAVAASISASTAVPFSSLVGSWQVALSVWSLPGFFALLLWILLRNELATRQTDTKTLSLSSIEEPPIQGTQTSVYRQPRAWLLVAFFGIQSLGFYALLAWLPSLLIDGGATATEAGGVLGVTTIAGVPFGMLLGSNLKRFKSLSAPAAIASGLTTVGMILLLTPFSLAAGIVIGLGQASTFPISLNLISTRATTVAQTTELSTLSQGYGYLAAALGTFVFGWLRDISGNWILPIILLVLLSALQLYSGLIAGRNRVIENPAA